jgi:hypothetical protein
MICYAKLEYPVKRLLENKDYSGIVFIKLFSVGAMAEKPI